MGISIDKARTVSLSIDGYLQEIEDAGTTAQALARGNLGQSTSENVADGALGSEKFKTGVDEGAWIRDVLVSAGIIDLSYSSPNSTHEKLRELFRDNTTYTRDNNPPIQIPGTFTCEASGFIGISFLYSWGSGSSDDAKIEIWRNNTRIELINVNSSNSNSLFSDVYSVSQGDVISFRVGDDTGGRNASIYDRVIQTKVRGF